MGTLCNVSRALCKGFLINIVPIAFQCLGTARFRWWRLLASRASKTLAPQEADLSTPEMWGRNSSDGPELAPEEGS